MNDLTSWESMEAELRGLEAQLLLLESLKPASSGRETLPLRRVSAEGPLPLSFAQERLWLLDRLIPGSALYNIPSAVGLRGRLQVWILQRCLGEIIRRHEVLRTTFQPVEDGCVQVIADTAPVPLPVVDLQGLPAGPVAQVVRCLAAAEAAYPFDLRSGPLLRATLLRLDGEEHALLFTMHHIVGDGWSSGIFIRELVALYRAFVEGRPSTLPELPIQYGDFAVWQRQWLSGDVLQREITYWRERLTGMPEQLELPVDRPRPPVQTYWGAGRLEVLEVPLATALHELALTEGATLFMVLLTAFQTLLARYCGQQDFGIGTPVAGRSRVEVEGLIGFFVNTLVLRSDLAGDPSFRRLLSRVRHSTLAAYDHQSLPFERLVEELAPERNLSRSPLFQVMFTHENVQTAAIDLPGLAVQPLDAAGQVAKFDLTLSMTGSTEALTAGLLYNRDLFDASTATRMLQHWRTLLAAVVVDPDQRVSALPLLADGEAHQLLHEWGTKGEEHLRARPMSLPELFEAQVLASPEALALSFEGGSWTYRELRRRSGLLAKHLHRLGVSPGVRVAVCLERSPELVAALLAILEAGGAYLPIDPTYPPERKAFMLEDSGAQLLLTRSDLLAALPAHGAQALYLDRESWQDETGCDLPRAVAEAPAYVIYTSGSTGRPKGVVIPHTNVERLFAATEAWFDFGPADVWTLFHSYAFDFSVWEIWGALLHGGRLVIVPCGVTRMPDVFYDLLCRERVTVLNQTPSAFRQLVWAEEEALSRRAGLAPELALRVVIFGGEALELSSLVPWVERHGDERPELINMYGITETTVHVTYRRLRRGDLEGVSSPIGRSIPDLDLYLLDSGLQPVPAGVPGEVYVGGAGLALGYLRRPALTAGRFIPDPFAAARAGARLYRTGDVARYRPDGELEYLGRIDNQVKIRGFRVELGEIESALTAHPAVRQAVVVVRDGPEGDKRLVAYVVGPSGSRPVATELRDALGERLPAHMVPAAFVVMEDLPLTANGKIDRDALQLPEDTRLDRQADLDAPSNQIEEIVGGVYAQVLGADAIVRDSDFFMLGGHSLLATQVISRLQRTFGVELPLIALFESPTVAGLAQRVEAALHGGLEVQAPPLRRLARDGELPLSFAQQRLWFIDQLEPGNPAYNISMALLFSGQLDLEVLAASLGEIVDRHEALRTRFESVNGKPRQVIVPAGAVNLPLIDLTSLPHQVTELQRLAKDEAQRSFDLVAGQLLRVTTLRLGAAEHAALLSMHHIVSDGWSLGILVRELGALYQAFSAGRPSPLEELPIQYADFAGWQRSWLSGEVLERQLRYWQEQLAGAPEVLSLPLDRPRPAESDHRGARRPLLVPAGRAEELRRLARSEECTTFMVLLAALQTLLARWCGQEDLSVGTPIAGRTHLETEGLIGFFVNTLVLRSNLSGDPPFHELLARVRTTTLGAFAHQDLPFERLVDALQLERSLSHSPLFQVMLALQNVPVSAVSLPSLTLSRIAVETDVTQFDLMLFLRERDGGLAGSLEYRSELFDAVTVLRLIEHLEVLLEGVVAVPEARLSELPLLTSAERFQLVTEWNAARTEYEGEPCLHELIEAQVARTPVAEAVIFEGERLTYRELDARANRLAHRLRQLGTGPESVVGVCLERSLELMIALLAVLKAGGAYLPLDPSYPEERLAQMLEDSGACVVITSHALTARLPMERAERLCLDLEQEALARYPTSLAGTGVGPDNAAYVIYTSGSTGRPKGVINTHRAIRNRLLWMQDAYRLTGGDRVLQKTPFSFDVSVWEFFWPLITGACLVVARPQGHQDSGYLVERIVRERITTLHFVPSMLQVFLEEPRLQECRSLRRVITSGEALPWDLQQRLFERLTGVELHNLYGPTEAAVDVTFWACRSDVHPRLVPIGRPIANTEIHLLDRGLQPVPVGVAGELYIGGIALARGYLHRPDLTAERFVPSPFGEQPGARLYRTGDLVRRLSGGELDYLGRIDHQVKIRGFRIELGEIEAALAEHPGIREVVVLAREDRPGERRLVAYVVPLAGDALTVSSLSAYLGTRLPSYMVPAIFLLLPALPLLPTGKMDRRALPAPGRERPELEASLAAPQTRAERLLRDIWAEVLGLDEVGIHDNFFELGGDSILSIQLVAKANQAGLGLTPRQIFQHPTIAGLAAVAGSAPIVDAEQGPVTGPVPLTPIQAWFFEEDLAELHHFNQSVMLTARTAVSSAELETILGELLARHDALRLRFFRDRDGWQQWNAPAPGPVPFCRVDLSLLPAGRRSPCLEAAAAQAQTGFDLTDGPLLRAVFFDLGKAEEGRLLLAIHHLAVDWVSWRILLGDLETALGQLRRGEAVLLPAKTTSFKRWAECLTEHARSHALRTELDHWLAPARGRVAPLPVDGEPGPGSKRSSRMVSVFLTAEETQSLLQEVPAASRVQVEEVLVTALAQAFRHWTGEDRLLLEMEGHGREEISDDVDLTRTVGWFTTLFPVLVDLEPGSAPGDDLVRTKERLRSIPGRGVGYGLLRYLGQDEPGGRLLALPRPQVLFNYLGRFDGVLTESSLFGPAPESTGPNQSPRAKRSHLLDIGAWVSGGRLGVGFTYSETVHRASTIERLAGHFLQALQTLIACARVPGGTQVAVTDFPLVSLGQSELEQALQEIGFEGFGDSDEYEER